MEEGQPSGALAHPRFEITRCLLRQVFAELLQHPVRFG
jgi:hypothetical protein